MLVDHSGSAIIDPTGAEMRITWLSTFYLDPKQSTPDQLVFLTKKHQYGLCASYNEVVIMPGARVMVRGAGTREPDPAGTATEVYRGSPTRLRLINSRRYHMVISGAPKARQP